MTLPIRNSRIRLSQGQLFWREVGQGTVLVFLHGSWNDSSQWLPLVEHLSQTYHCLVPDLLGFGESEHPKLHYSIELQVECLAEYLEALKLRQIYLVGHSLGGWIASSYALRFPDQVKGLILLSPEGVQPEGKSNRWQWSRWLTGRPPLAFWLLQLLLPFAKVFGWREWVERSLQLRQKLMRSPVACKLLFNRRAAEIRAELLPADQISWLKLPILILQRQDDAVAIHSHQVFAQAPQAELKVISSFDSDLLQTEAKAIASEIRQFVDTPDTV
jgi:pimeloyl-ACP methyl ester carboxylesterase